jgi:hypothetical protein
MITDLNPLVSLPIILVVIALMGLAGYWPLILQYKKGIASKRLVAKSLLLLGFLLSLTFVLLRPQRPIHAEKDQILVYAENLDRSVVEFWKDSLRIKKTVPLNKFEQAKSKVYVLGESFTKEQLLPFRNQDFEWVLPNLHGVISDISWKGYVRKGENQRLHFRIYSANDSSRLFLQVPGFQALTLKKGWNDQVISFSSSGQGRMEHPILIDQDTLVSIRYFVGSSVPKKYHFQLGFPSSESRTLSNWLRTKGEKVSEQIRLSRETVMESGTQDSLQVRIIDPTQVDQKTIQDWSKKGEGSLVLIQVSDAQETVLKLNRQFGTDFKINKSGTESRRILKNGLEALPFVFEEKSGQNLLAESSIAVQKGLGGQVALSLIDASYPLILQGKVSEYETIWGELFGILEPDEPNGWRFKAPVLEGITQDIQLFQRDSLPELLTNGQDTIYFQKSPVNPFLAKANWKSKEASWLNLREDLALFVYSPEQVSSLHTRFWVEEIQRNATKEIKSETVPVSPWIGLVGMLVFLGFLWLEPKLG